MRLNIKIAFILIILPILLNFSCFKKSLANNQANLVRIKSNGKYGYRDKLGKIIVKPIYDDVQLTPEGVIVVIKNNKLGLIGRNGKILAPLKYKAGLLEYHFNFSDGLAAVIKETKDGYNNCVYIDKTGIEVLDPQKFNFSTVQDESYGVCSEFSEGLAPATISGTGDYGYINKQGKMVFNLNNISIDDLMCGDALCILGFKNGVAAIAVDGKWQYIDKTGKFISKKAALKKRKELME